VIIQTLSIQDDLIQIKALAGSEISIAQFISNAKADKTFKNVELGQTSTQESNQFLISFSMNIKY
jgi:Tfp pilus assembly protein PilN